MKINLNSVFKLLITALALSLALLFCSCGARKAEKNRTKETIKAETSIAAVIEKKEESNVKKTETTTVDDKTETVTKETFYEPIDNTKPASVIDTDGAETKLNNSKKTTRETTYKNNTHKENLINTVITSTSEAIEKIKSESKTTAKKTTELIKIDKKVWNVYNLLWLIIPIAIVYLAWKNKAKIITWLNGLWWI